MTTEATVGRGPLGRIREVVADPESLRSWTAVANDAIIATAGILEGFAGAGADDHALVVAATVATVAGLLAAGGAKFAEVDAEREAQVAAAADEAASLAIAPEVELEELVAYYEAKGLSPHLARQVAEELMAHDAIAAQLESEHGILEPISFSDAVLAGVGASVAYAIGAAIPLAITIFVPATIETWLIAGAVVVSLLGTSIIGARTGQMHVGRTVVRTLAIGIGTMVVSFAVGSLVF
jgi:vacuolar iron transporter family protein